MVDKILQELEKKIARARDWEYVVSRNRDGSCRTYYSASIGSDLSVEILDEGELILYRLETERDWEGYLRSYSRNVYSTKESKVALEILARENKKIRKKELETQEEIKRHNIEREKQERRSLLKALKN